MKFKKLAPEVIRQHKGISFPGVTTLFICHDGQGKLFLAQRSKKARDEHGRWDVGGGGLKHGQSAEDNMRREAFEEYNAVPKKVEFLGYIDAFRTTPDGTPTHWLALCFAVEVDPKQIRIKEPDMFEEYGWFELDNLPQPMHSQFPVFYKKHGAKLRQILKRKVQ